jgi:hypothetical protein
MPFSLGVLRLSGRGGVDALAAGCLDAATRDRDSMPEPAMAPITGAPIRLSASLVARWPTTSPRRPALADWMTPGSAWPKTVALPDVNLSI